MFWPNSHKLYMTKSVCVCVCVAIRHSGQRSSTPVEINSSVIYYTAFINIEIITEVSHHQTINVTVKVRAFQFELLRCGV